jgi:transposase-like protein
MSDTDNASGVQERGVGRPTLYSPEFVQQVAEACVNGATVNDIAELLGVSRSTVNEWRIRYPEFSTALKVGRDKADDRIEASLYERAAGYSHPDVHIAVQQGEVTITPIVKHYPPDTAAAFIWLKNRRGWKDKQEHEVTHTLSDQMRAILASNPSQ